MQLHMGAYGEAQHNQEFGDAKGKAGFQVQGEDGFLGRDWELRKNVILQVYFDKLKKPGCSKSKMSSINE